MKQDQVNTVLPQP